MTKIVIGIHGLGNKPAATTLYEKGWYRAMVEGLQHSTNHTDPSFAFEGVYWADKNYKKFDTKGETYRKAKKGAIKTYQESFLDDIARKVDEVGGSLLDWLKDRVIQAKLANMVLSKGIKDLDRYYKPDKKSYKELTDLLIETLEKHADKRIMLVGHSMGSIIAYDALRIMGRTSSQVEIDHFVTLGSPLGLPHIVKKMNELHGEPRTPTLVKRWSNFSDRRDPVATDEYLKDDYKPNVAGVRVKDDLVLNDWRVKDGEDIFHKSYGYLRTPEFSKMLAEFI